MSLQRIVAPLALVILSLMGPTLARAATEGFPMVAQRVADGVYAVVTPTRELPNPENRGWNSNSAFVVTGAGVLLLDTGSSEAIGEALRHTIARVTDQPVRWVIVSHGHGDHWLGTAAFGPDVEVIASSAVAAHVRSDGESWIANFRRLTAGATGDPRIVPPTTLIDERTTRRFGGVEAVVIPSGGAHSPGDLMVWLPGPRVLLAGDVVYSDRMPSTGSGDLRRWIAVLAEMRALDPSPVAVVAGHGVVTDLTGVRRLHDLLADLWQAVQTGYEAGLAAHEMVAQVQAALASYRAGFPGLDEKVARDIGRVYLQVEAASFE
jgi:cyclase